MPKRSVALPAVGMLPRIPRSVSRRYRRLEPSGLRTAQVSIRLGWKQPGLTRTTRVQADNRGSQPITGVYTLAFMIPPLNNRGLQPTTGVHTRNRGLQPTTAVDTSAFMIPPLNTRGLHAGLYDYATHAAPNWRTCTMAPLTLVGRNRPAMTRSLARPSPGSDYRGRPGCSVVPTQPYISKTDPSKIVTLTVCADYSIRTT
jgi:hypothetical protein